MKETGKKESPQTREKRHQRANSHGKFSGREKGVCLEPEGLWLR